MKDIIDLARDIDKFRDIMLDDPKSGVSLEMAQVGRCAGDQVVDRQNFPAAIEEVVAQVRSKKSRSSCDYRAHLNGLSMWPLSG
jgi:hypothetical protein